MEQPVFGLVPGDVDRKIRASFPDPADAAQAAEMLAAYEPIGSVDPDRVRLAALYISGGTLQRLEQALDEARMDWRDVLVTAEYREYAALPLDAPDVEREAAMRSDWDRYTSWVAAD